MQHLKKAKSVLFKKVLVLNRNYQAVDVMTVKKAFGAVASGIARAILMEDEGQAVPMTFDEWIKLPTEGHECIQTPRGPVRLPRLIQAVNCVIMPKRRQRCTRRAIWERDNFKCQYTGVQVIPGVTGNLDHVDPRSRGGKMTFSNMVVSAIKVNTAKGARTPQEAGLRLLKRPSEPSKVPAMLLIENEEGVPEWDHFLIKSRRLRG